MICPTVNVKSSHPDHVRGFYTINESDFDPKIHELWVDEAAEIKKAAAAKAAQVNADKPRLGISAGRDAEHDISGRKPSAPGMSSGAGSDRNR
jgi:hypothetical protein